MAFQEFLPIYLMFLFIVTLERVTNTFFQKNMKKNGVIFYRWSFPLLLGGYLFIVIYSIVGFFLSRNLIDVRIVLIGFLCYVIGVYLRRKAIEELGNNWSVHIEIKENHRLITTGIYEKMRHPYYMAVIWELLGICLISNSYTAVILIFVFQLPLLFLRINLEEQTMLRCFGEEYRRYLKK